MKLRDLLDILKTGQIVKIIDGFIVLCDVYWDRDKSMNLLRDYLDTDVCMIRSHYSKTSDDEIKTHLCVCLDIKKEEPKPEVDNNSHVKIEPVNVVDLLSCKCGGGEPKYMYDNGIAQLSDAHYSKHIFACEQCHRYAASDKSMMDAAVRWNKLYGDTGAKEEKKPEVLDKPNNEPNTKMIDILPCICGGMGEIEMMTWESGRRFSYGVRCNKCKNYNTGFDSPREAIEAWNEDMKNGE